MVVIILVIIVVIIVVPLLELLPALLQSFADRGGTCAYAINNNTVDR